MSTILGIIVPVFGLIAIGHLATRLGYFKDAWIDGLSAYVFRFAIPPLLFLGVSSTPFAEIFNAGVLLSYFGGVAAACVGAALLSRAFFGRHGLDLVPIAVGGGYSNLVLIGIPLVDAAFGGIAGTPLALVIAVHGPLVLGSASVAAAILREDGEARSAGAILQGVLSDIAKNPIILSILLGLVWNLLALPMPQVVSDVLGALGRSAGPCALFASGAALTRFTVARSIGVAGVITVVKLLLMPALVAVLALLVFDVPYDAARIIIVSAALPTGVNAYLVASYYGRGEGATSSAMVISTAISVVTVSAVLLVLGIDPPG